MKHTVRNLRIAAAAVIAAVVVWALLPYVLSYVSSQAVVNAPLDTILSPISGQITRRSAPAGAVVRPGATLVAVAAEERDRRYIEELTGRVAAIVESVRAIEAERAELTALQGVMSGRIAQYGSHMLARLAAERAAAQAALASARASADTAAATVARTRSLVRRGHAAAAQVEAEAAVLAAARAEVTREEARLARVAVEAGAVTEGIFVNEGWSDVPYSQQRLDEIALRLAALTSEQRRQEGERATTERQIIAERRMIAARENFLPLASSEGVVWKASGSVGVTVVPGDVLMQMVNCESRFLEVTLPERLFGDIAPGDLATVHLKGDGTTVTAPVTAVLGAGAKFDHPQLAAAVPDAQPGNLRVLISLSGVDLGGEAGNFCQVGRTAEVRIARRDLDLVRRGVEAVTARVSGALGSARASAPPRPGLGPPPGGTR